MSRHYIIFVWKCILNEYSSNLVPLNWEKEWSMTDVVTFRPLYGSSSKKPPVYTPAFLLQISEPKQRQPWWHHHRLFSQTWQRPSGATEDIIQVAESDCHLYVKLMEFQMEFRYQMYKGEIWEEDHWHREIFRKVISMGMMKASETSHSSSTMWMLSRVSVV